MVALPTPARVATCSRRSPEKPSSTSSAWAASRIGPMRPVTARRPRRAAVRATPSRRRPPGSRGRGVPAIGSIVDHPARLRNGAYQCMARGAASGPPARRPPPTGGRRDRRPQAAMATSRASSWRWWSTTRTPLRSQERRPAAGLLERGALEPEAVALGIDGHERTTRAIGRLAERVVDELQHPHAGRRPRASRVR